MKIHFVLGCVQLLLEALGTFCPSLLSQIQALNVLNEFLIQALDISCRYVQLSIPPSVACVRALQFLLSLLHLPVSSLIDVPASSCYNQTFA